MTRKGDHIPKEDRGEGTPLNQAREEEPRLKEQHGSRAGQRKPKLTAAVGGRETTRRLKANPTKVGKATSRLWTEQEHRPDQRQVTKHADHAQHQTLEARGTAAPLWPANKYPTKNQGNNHRSRATEVGQLRKNLNHPEPAANTGSEKDEPKAKRKKKQAPGPSNCQRWE